MNSINLQDYDQLLARYRGRKHPLDWHNRYQLMTMVLLSARDSDKHINELAPAFFARYPTLADLARAGSPADLAPFLGSVMSFDNKARWLITLAKNIGSDDLIPRDLAGLTKHAGIGRKSANVIIRESGDPAEGIIVDLHVIRVAPRLGLVPKGTVDATRIEKQLMALFPREVWGEIGMALSFLGRETCRPSQPKCDTCPLQDTCIDHRAGIF